MNPLLKDIFAEAQHVITAAAKKGLTLATAESCTGGLIGAAITAIPGSSQIFMGGVIAYDNQIKTQLLGVSASQITQHGAVSQDVAIAMAKGAINALNVDIAISVTGIAGPGGGTAEKPVGTVWMGVAKRYKDRSLHAGATLYEFGDIGRNKIRDQTCFDALKTLHQHLTDSLL